MYTEYKELMHVNPKTISINIILSDTWQYTQNLWTIQNCFLFFRNGNFAVKKKESCFNRAALNQIIEQTIKNIAGYGTTPGKVQRWVLTSYIIAQYVLANPHSQKKDIEKVLCRPTSWSFERMHKSICTSTISNAEILMYPLM